MKKNLKLDLNAEINIMNETRDNQLPNVGENDFHRIEKSKNN